MLDLRQRLQTALGNAYVIERELDGAGMSRVFIATETALGRRVVIKVLPPELAAEVRVERFRREIQVAARLQHPHIIPVLSSGEADGVLYYTMPFVEGDTLRARLERDYQLEPPEAARIWRDLLEALAYAHEQGIIHRDIKPENIILSRGHALATDFGVAKAISTAAGTDTPFTANGVVVGTPAYMSPEQATAEPDVDHRADLYSTAVVAYEMLAGQPPFSGHSARAVLSAQAERRPVPVDERRDGIPPALAALVMRCLATRPAARPASAAAVVEALDAAALSRATPVRALVPVGALRRLGRRPLERAFLSAAAVGIAVGAIAASVTRRPASPAPESPSVALAPIRLTSDDAELHGEAAALTLYLNAGLERVQTARLIGDTARAQLVVAGDLSRAGDSVTITMRLVDRRTGQILRALRSVRALMLDTASALSALRERIAGGVAIATSAATGGADALPAGDPPPFDAFTEFREGFAQQRRRSDSAAAVHFARAARTDARFAQASLQLASSLIHLGERARADSALSALRTRGAELTPLEAAQWEMLRAAITRDHPSLLADVRRVVAIAGPSSPLVGDWYFVALTANDRPREAKSLLEQVGPRPEDSARYLEQLADVSHFLGDHDAQPGAALALERMRRGPSANAAQAAANAARELRAHGQHAQADTLLAATLSWYAAHSEADARGTAAAYAGALLDARRPRDALRVIAASPEDARRDLRALALSGCAYAMLGDSAAALRASSQIAATSADAGWEAFAARARIMALLGRRSEAVALLQQAFAHGAMFDLRLSLHSDPAFASLSGYAPFEALLAPGG
jgi:serine/threonine-protein kinase